MRHGVGMTSNPRNSIFSGITLGITALVALAACSSSSTAEVAPDASLAVSTTQTPTTSVVETTLPEVTTTVAPSTTPPVVTSTIAPPTTKPAAKPVTTTQPPKATTTVPQNTTKSSAEILADAKAGMEAAETKFALGGSFSDLVASKLQIEKRYASVGMQIIPNATEQMYYNIKFSGVSNCFLADFDGSRSVFVPSACW